jgi:hypothetical protein
MKSRAIAILVFASLVCAGFAAPAFAQSAQVQAQYQHYLNTHPELRANPGLINDPAWRSNHQGLVHWLNQHPNMRNRAMWMGDYDNSHQWHNEDWWYHNNPNWMYQHHPDWVRGNPEWRNDGDWDDQQRWHDRDWWVNNNHAWVEQHHPNWAENRGYQNPNRGEEHYGNGHAYGHDKDHGDRGHGDQGYGDHGDGHGHGHDD